MNQLSRKEATLNSWKEIAVYLGRGVRTVQRWERELGLPVHRIRETEHSPVFAFPGELNAWLDSRRKAGSSRVPSPHSETLPPLPQRAAAELLDRSLQLSQRMAVLLDETRRAKELRAHLAVTVAEVQRNLRMAVEKIGQLS